MPKPTLIIVIEGGIVQDVVSDDSSIVGQFLERIVVIDYDTDGADKDICSITQSDGSSIEAVVTERPITKATIDVDELHNHLDQYDEDA